MSWMRLDGDIHYNNRRVVELFRPTRPLGGGLHHSLGHSFASIPAAMDSATLNQTLVPELFLCGVLGVGEAVTEDHQSASRPPSEASLAVYRAFANIPIGKPSEFSLSISPVE